MTGTRTGRALDGEVALVTGGAKRIGAAIATALHEAGASVVVHHRSSRAEAEALAGRLGGWTVAADLSEPAELERLVPAAAEAAGRPVTLLVNNASSYPEDRLASLTWERLQEALLVNAWAPLGLTRALVRQLPEGKVGAVVNLVDARVADYDWAHVGYWLAKRMVADLTRLCAVDFGPRVRVNGVSPGAVLGPSNRPMAAQEEAEFLARMARHVPLRRTPTPEDVASAVVHLLALESATGTIVEVDGGRHLGRATYG
jgi:NAD(P)-dependent dehydrogenase (short-subunit alcohol dehydrogenase family)